MEMPNAFLMQHQVWGQRQVLKQTAVQRVPQSPHSRRTVSGRASRRQHLPHYPLQSGTNSRNSL